jgi:hypothetical protein
MTERGKGKGQFSILDSRFSILSSQFSVSGPQFLNLGKDSRVRLHRARCSYIFDT